MGPCLVVATGRQAEEEVPVEAAIGVAAGALAYLPGLVPVLDAVVPAPVAVALVAGQASAGAGLEEEA